MQTQVARTDARVAEFAGPSVRPTALQIDPLRSFPWVPALEAEQQEAKPKAGGFLDAITK